MLRARRGGWPAEGPAGALDASTLVQVQETSADGSKTATALCPLTEDPDDDEAARTFAISGGFIGQGAVTESYRSAEGHGWTATTTSDEGIKDYAYCVG